MRGRRAAIIASIASVCAACEALVGITDREEAAKPSDAGTAQEAGPVVRPQGTDATDAVDAVGPLETSAGYTCAKGGCNTQGGSCPAAATCYCTADSECHGNKCVAVPGENDIACGGACSGSGATDGFGCELATCVPTRFTYTPSTFAPAKYSPPTMPTTDCNGTYSSTSHAFTEGGCSGQPPLVVSNVAQTGGGHVVDILLFQSLTIATTSTLAIVGGNPVVLAVYGDATIHGAIDASANGTTPGAGADECPSHSNGADAGTGSWEPGGGGGGQSSAGGVGGASRGAAGEPAGNAQGTDTVPLTGGCAGGLPFVGSLGYSPSAGAGGGGIQVSAAGILDFAGGSIAANASNGGNGEPGKCNGIAQNGTGGAGGGSGGTLLLEGASIVSGTTAASGGAGGVGGAAPAPNSQAGGDGGAGGAAGAGGATGGAGVQKGSAPSGCTWGGYWSGGGGGGGGGGYVKTNQGGSACPCTADSDCATGLCSNVSGQCSGTCTGTTTAGAYDSIDCQILKTSAP
jgi:hypothetical protein